MKGQIKNYQVYRVDGLNVVHVPVGRGEALRSHLHSHGIESAVSEIEAPFERVKIESDVTPETIQVILDHWAR